MNARAAAPIIAVGTIAVSFSAVFIRIANSDPGTIVWLRIAIATVLLTPFALGDAVRRRTFPDRSGLVAVAGSGALLAGH